MREGIEALAVFIGCIFAFITFLEIWNKIVWKPIQNWFAYGAFYKRGVTKKYGIEVARYMVDYGYSAKRARKQVREDEMENVKIRETDRRSFTAMVDCPKCGVWAFHWLKGRARIGHVTRQCRECGHEWRQM